MVYIGTALIDSDNLMSGVVLEDLNGLYRHSSHRQ